jgi:hypothetical protein
LQGFKAVWGERSPLIEHAPPRPKRPDDPKPAAPGLEGATLAVGSTRLKAFHGNHHGNKREWTADEIVATINKLWGRGESQGMSKKKPRPRNAGKTAYDFIQYCAELLKARVAAGAHSDKPGLEAAITEFDPAIALVEIPADPTSTPDMRAAVSAKLMPYWHKEQSLLVKQGDDVDRSVTVIPSGRQSAVSTQAR